MKTILWNPEKNEKLKRERGVSFDEALHHIERNDLIGITAHPHQERYPGQQMYIIRMRNYVYLVPYIETEDKIFLKTIIPSRKAVRRYKNG
jgi:uncharacterized DUF497 family protein